LWSVFGFDYFKGKDLGKERNQKIFLRKKLEKNISMMNNILPEKKLKVPSFFVKKSF